MFRRSVYLRIQFLADGERQDQDGSIRDEGVDVHADADKERLRADDAVDQRLDPQDPDGQDKEA